MRHKKTARERAKRREAIENIAFGIGMTITIAGIGWFFLWIINAVFIAMGVV